MAALTAEYTAERGAWQLPPAAHAHPMPDTQRHFTREAEAQPTPPPIRTTTPPKSHPHVLLGVNRRPSASSTSSRCGAERWTAKRSRTAHNPPLQRVARTAAVCSSALAVCASSMSILARPPGAAGAACCAKYVYMYMTLRISAERRAPPTCFRSAERRSNRGCFAFVFVLCERRKRFGDQNKRLQWMPRKLLLHLTKKEAKAINTGILRIACVACVSLRKIAMLQYTDARDEGAICVVRPSGKIRKGAPLSGSSCRGAPLQPHPLLPLQWLEALTTECAGYVQSLRLGVVVRCQLVLMKFTCPCN